MVRMRRPDIVFKRNDAIARALAFDFWPEVFHRTIEYGHLGAVGKVLSIDNERATPVKTGGIEDGWNGKWR